jgi:hypothetical protein
MVNSLGGSMNRVKLSFLPITLAIFLCACSANSEVPDQTSFVEEIEKVNTDFTDNVSALAKKTTEVTGLLMPVFRR